MRPSSMLLLCAAAAMGCSTDGSGPPCSPTGAVTVAMTQPSSFACHVDYTASFTMTNASCTTVTINSFELTGAITSSPNGETCSPATPFQGAPSDLKASSVLGGNTIDVLDYKGGAFCCIAPGPCPADFICHETFTGVFHTSAGDISASVPAEIDLQSCTEVCQ
jgi:hypothetical protein